MHKLVRLLKGHKYALFLDFEGTQFSHEMIAYGAVLATLDKEGNIKKLKNPTRGYVKPKNKIGRYVKQLTGISENDIQTKGVSFATALKQIKSYCGLHFSKCSFITFGSHDLVILNKSLSYNLDADKDILKQISHNFIDFSAFISEFVKDDHNNPYSLVNYCKLFKVKEAGQAHDPEIDAINLANLYDAFLKEKEIVLEQYLKVLSNLFHLPEPVKQAAKKLANGQDVTSLEFTECARKYIQ